MNTCLMLRNSWGGVGWDVLTFVAHEHMFDATQLTAALFAGLLTFLASAHMFYATQLLRCSLGC